MALSIRCEFIKIDLRITGYKHANLSRRLPSLTVSISIHLKWLSSTQRLRIFLIFFSNSLSSKDFNWKVWFQIILIVLYTRSLLLPRFYSIIDLDNKSIVPQFELTESKNSHNITNKVLLFYKVNSVEAYRLYLYLTICLALLHHRKK